MKYLSGWLDEAVTLLASPLEPGEPRHPGHDPQNDVALWVSLQSVDWSSEVQWLLDMCERVESPITFCHNDAQEGNIMMEDTPTGPRLTLIDFEYSNYNWRGYDLGNHICEMSLDYSPKEWPLFMVHEEPSKAFRLDFIRRYLDEVAHIQGTAKVSTEQVTHLDRELQTFQLASHLAWALWSMSMASSDIPFGYLEYCHARLDLYWKGKKKLLSSSAL